MRFQDRDLLALPPEERAREGLFLGFQYPVEIAGVNNAYLMRAALNAARRHRGQPEVDAFDFLTLVREKMQLMKMDEAFLSRGVNEGFSGGEKKRNEILQMLVLEPKLAVLDETDSGLDIDALKIVSAGVNSLRAPERAIVLVTHYQRLLDHVRPDRVHVLARGRILRSGGRSSRWNSRSAATTGCWTPRHEHGRFQGAGADGVRRDRRSPARAGGPAGRAPVGAGAARGARSAGTARRCLALLEPATAAGSEPAARVERCPFRRGARAAAGCARRSAAPGVHRRSARCRCVHRGCGAHRAAHPAGAALPERTPDTRFALLNDLFALDEARFAVERDCLLEIVFIATPGTAAVSSYPRVHLAVSPGVHLTLVERHLGGGGGRADQCRGTADDGA